MKKLYTATGIGIAAFLGGPLAAGYLIAENYKVIGKQETAKRSLVSSILITVILFSTIFLLPANISEHIPRYIMPIIFLSIAQLIVNKYQKSDIEVLIANGSEYYSNWRSAGISLLFALLSLVMALILFVVIDLLMP